MRHVARQCCLRLALTTITLGYGPRLAHAEGAGKVSCSDMSVFECYSYDAAGRLAGVVYANSERAVIDGGITDEISAESAIKEVTLSCQPQPGYEHRMRFRSADSSTWGRWSDWTTGRIEHDTPVPAPG